jgi:hypothetical protein
VLDFGLARIDGEETLTAAGDVPGTLAYIPPERLRGAAAGPAADVWAVGVLLWEALAGWHPFWKGSLLETARRIESGAVSLGRARPDLPKPLIALVDRALALDPARRPTAARMAAGVRAAADSRRRTRTRPSLAAPPPERLAAAALAAVTAGWSAFALPFYPNGWPLGLAVAAAALTLIRERLGLALALAVPVFPLGNLSSGLAWVYGIVALVWLALSWRDARAGLFFVAGPLLAPVSALALLPLAAQVVRGRIRRGLQAAAAVAAAAVVAAIGRAPHVPALVAQGSPSAASRTLVHAASPSLLAQMLVLGSAAALLPVARSFGHRGIAAFGVALIGGVAVTSPDAPMLTLVGAATATLLALASAQQNEH